MSAPWVTLAKSSYMFGLPVSLYPKISAVPGVETATYLSGFGGTYQDPRNHADRKSTRLNSSHH